MHKLVLSTAIAALLFGTGVANADVHALGNVTTGAPTSFNAIADKGSFTDFFKFSMPANSGSGFSVMDFFIPGSYNVRFDSFSIFSNDDGKIGNADDLELFSIVKISGKALDFTMGPKDAGKYYLKITGTGLGKNGGLYNGSISVSAVPETESYAMLLAGLGLIGTIARRRSKSTAV